eukprot:tig00020703_g13137.t1
MAASGSKGIEAVVQKLEKSVDDGDFYTAQQSYKSLYFRYCGQKKFDDARQLLMSGARLMQKHKQFQCATELATLLVELFQKADVKVAPDSIDALLKTFEGFGEDNSNGPVQFLKAAIKWSAGAGAGKFGSPELNAAMGRHLWKQGDYGGAQRYFVRGNDPRSLARMLLEWSGKGYPAEVDLFLARAVLQLLCVQNLRDANVVFDTFLRTAPGGPPRTPLVNFLRFLLATLERDAAPLLAVLRSKYRPSIARDPSFPNYLDHIANKFYNVPIPTSGLQGIMDMLNGFLGGGDDDASPMAQ